MLLLFRSFAVFYGLVGKVCIDVGRELRNLERFTVAFISNSFFSSGYEMGLETGNFYFFVLAE